MKFKMVEFQSGAAYPWAYFAQVSLQDLTSKDFDRTWDEVAAWLSRESAPEFWWRGSSATGGYVSFAREDHAMAFKLRWC